MSSCPEFQISNHSPPGHASPSYDGQGLAITSLIFKSEGTAGIGAAAGSFIVPGVVELVPTQSFAELVGSSSRLNPEGIPEDE